MIIEILVKGYDFTKLELQTYIHLCSFQNTMLLFTDTETQDDSDQEVSLLS